MNFKESFSVNTDSVSKTNEKYVVTCEKVRVSVITEKLYRVEYSKNGVFTDSATQKVINRNFASPVFRTKRTGGFLIVGTRQNGVCVDLSNGRVVYAVADGKKINDLQKENLKGTYRTLDGTIGAIQLGNGVVSRNGAAVFDDSSSLILNNDGTVSPRTQKEKDIYVFAYGHDYRGAVSDFICLTGGVPLIPRFALGNWWSRYKAYTQQEYADLIQRFINEKIPLTVATIDMDWHWVDLKKEFSGVPGANPKDIKSGWTGYSWNTHLFPDYKELLQWLKSKNLKITLNLHPADGVRFFEDMYNDFARYMGIDPQTKKKIPFDCADPKYMEAYFELIHHKYENDGVDFWWIDWQQGKKSSVKGLDPLWALNHYHYIDNCRNGKRGLILSRFAEEGSQRYPVGFSGDTTVNWDCLRFQPYFTSTASNIGYTWWSHDIGGHMGGKKDDELYVRWLQFGVFSPINRLHSTSNEFMGKEPWKYGYAAYHIAADLLRLRKRLIPYLYTMNYRTHKYGKALIEPMYYAYPEEDNAYKCKNQYLFGSQLICAPITEPADKKTGLASVDVWLPEGRYTDIFTRRSYRGGRFIKMFRGIENFPVLAKEGAVIPFDNDDVSNGAALPGSLELLAFSGNGSFTLYEDDGETEAYKNGECAFTKFEIKTSGNDISFTVSPVKGELSATVKARYYKINFADIVSAEKISAYKNGEPINFVECERNGISITLDGLICGSDEIRVELSEVKRYSLDKREAYIETVSKYKISNELKKSVFTSPLEEHTVPKCEKRYSQPIEEIYNCL